VKEDGEPNLEGAKPFVARVLEQLLPDRALDLINVNIPETPRGVAWTRQSVRHYAGRVVPDQDPLGRQHYWFTVAPIEAADEGTDRWAFEHDLVSVTPLRLDLTDNVALAASRLVHPFGEG
jgi:5'-nucleotidase